MMPEMNPEMLAQIMAGQIEEQKQNDEQFRKDQEAFNQRFQQAMADALKPKTAGRPLTPELAQLLGILQANPLIVGNVLRYTQELLAKVQQALQGVIGEEVHIVDPESKGNS